MSEFINVNHPLGSVLAEAIAALDWHIVPAAGFFKTNAPDAPPFWLDMRGERDVNQCACLLGSLVLSVLTADLGVIDTEGEVDSERR